MQLKTILNSVEKHKSFVYQEARWANPKTKTEIEIDDDLPLVPGRLGAARQMKADGYEPLLKHSRWCLLKRNNCHNRHTLTRLCGLPVYG